MFLESLYKQHSLSLRPVEKGIKRAVEGLMDTLLANAGYFGLSGVVIIFLAVLTTAAVYQGRDDEPYSLLNHFISELGERGISKLALVFNVGLILGGLMLALLMAGLGLFLHDSLGYLAAAAGVYAGASCSMVGVFPMNNLKRHIPVALSFFYSGLVFTSLFSVFILSDPQGKLPLWLLMPSLVTVASFVGFLFLPKRFDPKEVWSLDPSKFERPRLLLITILEWAVFVSVIGWLLGVSTYLVLAGV